MSALRILFSRLRGMFGRTRRDEELDSELESHLELLTEENIRKGISVEEARYAARREFGGVEQTKNIYRGQRGLPLVETLAQDLRFATRMLIKSPAFASVVVLTMAIGIGATTSVFSVVDRLLFRSLPYPHDEQLVSFGFFAPIEPTEFMLGTDYVNWRGRQEVFSSITSMRPGTRDCDLTSQNPARVSCAAVESTFLPTFGIQTLLGRNFTREEDRPHGPRAAVLSFGLWRARFGGDPEILHKTIEIDGQTTFVVGILPADFEMPTLASADILLPQALDEGAQVRPNSGAILRTFARLKPGVTTARAAAGLQSLFAESLRFVPPGFQKEVSLKVRSLRDRQIEDARLVSIILFGAVLAVLLVACTNVANLLLARAASRQREWAVRAALGASRARLIRQILTESVLLGLSGGALGGMVGYLLLHVFLSIAPQGIPRLQQASLDARVILFTFGVSLLSGVLFGLAPALQQPAPESLASKEVRASSRGWLRPVLIATQIGVSLVLLTGASLLLRSLWNLQNVSTGMQTENVLIETITLGNYRYPQPAEERAFFDQLQTRLRQLPGLVTVALSDSLPPSGGMRSTIFATIEVSGHPPFAEGTGGMVGWRAVTPEYFSALGISISRGRPFLKEDLAPGDNPIILNESLAKKLFPDENPLGKQMRFSRQVTWRTVVGIAAPVKNNGLAADADPEFYIPWKEDSAINFGTGNLLLRSEMNPHSLASWVRSVTAEIDPTVPFSMEALTQRVDKLAERPKFNAALLSLFAAMALLLAAIGIYGVVGFLVTQRTQEIGVRMALGASPGKIFSMVLGHIARWTLAGILLGLLGSWFATRWLDALLFSTRAHNPIFPASAAAILLIVAFFSAWIPARRAANLDPLVALRYE